jgi:tetratricopeptide (TPR) repeat protein
MNSRPDAAKSLPAENPSTSTGKAAAPNPQAEGESFVLTLPDDPASDKDWYLWAGVLALLVFVAFFPAITGQYIWDDDHHAGVIGPLHLNNLAGLLHIWTHDKFVTPQYYPLTFTTFWAEYLLWGDNTLGYHLDNFLLHAASAILVWRLLKRLKLPGAWLAAAIWAVHPLQTESVAWISERKNVLSGLLFFASIWCYLEFAGLAPPLGKKRGPGLSADGSTLLLGDTRLAYAASLILLILALLAKTVVCAMPAVMLILLWWRGRRLSDRKTYLPLLPFFAAGLAMSLITVYLETAPGGDVEARGPDWALTLLERFLIAGRGLWFYVSKLIWPSPLIFSYPRPLPTLDSLGPIFYAVQWGYLISAAAVFALLWKMTKAWGRGPLAAVLFYFVTLFPALGFINIFPMRYSFVADHFQYLSGLGLIVLAVAAVSSAARRLSAAPAAGVTVAAILLAALVFQSRLQSQIYQSPFALYQDILDKNPDSWMAADNLGIELIRRGTQEQQAVVNDTAQGDSDAATADKQQSQADFQKAEDLFHHALALRAGNYITRNSLGLLYRQMGRWDDSETELRKVVELDEQDEKPLQIVAPYVNYAEVLLHNHPGIDVRPWLQKALDLQGQPRVRPADIAKVHLGLGHYWISQAGVDSKAANSAAELFDLNEAVRELVTGLTDSPDDILGLFNLGRAYQRLGQIDQDAADRAAAAGRTSEAAELEYKTHAVDDANAMQAYLSATVLNPRYGPVAESLGDLYVRQILTSDDQAAAIDDLVRAEGCYNVALKNEPDIGGAAQNLLVVRDRFMDEGQKALNHESTWSPLQQAAAALVSSDVTKATATAAETALRTALWPLAKDHPLRLPLQDLRTALRVYLAPNAPDVAAKNVHDAADNLLKAWSDRSPARDAVADAMTAATCYEGAITADPRSGDAWRNLQSTIALLIKATAAQADVAGAKDALDRANYLLDQHRDATQPTTQPAVSAPTAVPAG